MIQPKYNPKEALEKMKLNMKYDTSKTLNENKLILEFLPAALLTVPWLITYGTTAVAAVSAWIYNVQGGGDSFTKTQSFFAGCSKNMKDLKPTVGKSEYRAAADSIYNAIEGVGTNLDSIRAALNSMPTVADLCALNSWYSTQYGDLYDDLDSDIDGTDFTKYVWSAIAPKVADAEDDLEKKDEKKDDGKKKTGGGYTPCTGTYQFGCKSDVIAKVQGCLGLVTDGKFGPKTKAALSEKGFTTFTDLDVDKICNKKVEVDTDIEDVDAEDPNQL